MSCDQPFFYVCMICALLGFTAIDAAKYRHYTRSPCIYIERRNGKERIGSES